MTATLLKHVAVKIEGFGGRPAVGGRPGARPQPLHPALTSGIDAVIDAVLDRVRGD